MACSSQNASPASLSVRACLTNWSVSVLIPAALGNGTAFPGRERKTTAESLARGPAKTGRDKGKAMGQGESYVRHHAKAPPGSSGRGEVRSTLARGLNGRGMFRVLGLCVVGLAAFLGNGSSPAAAETCPNEAFRLGPSASLPDCRAYEQVSPIDKNSQDVMSVIQAYENGDGGVASEDGSVAVYNAWAPFTDGTGAGLSTYRSFRSASGWQTEPIQPTHAAGSSLDLAKYQWFSGDLSVGALNAPDPPLVPGAPEGFNNLYLKTFGGSTELLTPTAPLNTPASTYYFFNGYSIVGRSNDGEHVVFESSDALTPDAPAFAKSLYDFSNGELHLVGVRPDGTPDPAGSVGGAGSGYWNFLEESAGNLAHAVSNDGTRIIWTSLSDGQIYVRLNGATTDPVSATQATTPDPNGSKPAAFACAAEDGSSVLFTSSSELTDNANTGEDGSGNSNDAGADLYRYDVNSEELQDLTVDTESTDSATGAAVQGVVGCSEDANTIYFVAFGKLAAGATSGSPNLYRAQGGSISFVTTLTSADSADWQAKPSGRTAVVSSNGSYLAFTSKASITGFDNTDGSGTPENEVYLYDAEAETISCASCRVIGKPEGSSKMMIETPFRMRRGLANGGRTIVFESEDAIVPADVNGRRDVYEYQAGGSPQLISSGNGSEDSQFLDASASGNDIFIVTRQQLVGQDRDDVSDLYDARVEGGFSEPPPPTECTGDTCQGSANGSPSAVVPGSAGFHGAGNARRHNRPIRRVGHLDRRQRRKLAQGGVVPLGLRTTRGGRISVAAQLRNGGRLRVALTGSGRAAGAGKATVRVHLTQAGMAQLRRRGSLTLSLRFRFNGVALGIGPMKLSLKAARHPSSKRPTRKSR